MIVAGLEESLNEGRDIRPMEVRDAHQQDKTQRNELEQSAQHRYKWSRLRGVYVQHPLWLTMMKKADTQI